MIVLGIMGSPRIKSNAHLLLEEALQGAASQQAEIKTLIVDKLKIEPCREYYACLKDGNCIIDDDMVPIYDDLWRCDVVIVSSPVFFYGIPAQLKALIDRCQALWSRRYVLKQSVPPGRKGAFIAVGATHGQRLFEGSVLTIKYFFKAIGVDYSGELLVRGVDERGEIRRHPELLQDAFKLGKSLV